MDNTIWIEKYRPTNFDQIIGQDKNINMLNKMITLGSLPHLLFHGKSGTGKTSTIMSIVRKLYGNNRTFMVMKLDASDDRGINTVREEIKGFADKMTPFNNGIKLITNWFTRAFVTAKTKYSGLDLFSESSKVRQENIKNVYDLQTEYEEHESDEDHNEDDEGPF